jgi:hypothetical protein
VRFHRNKDIGPARFFSPPMMRTVAPLIYSTPPE